MSDQTFRIGDRVRWLIWPKNRPPLAWGTITKVEYRKQGFSPRLCVDIDDGGRDVLLVGLQSVKVLDAVSELGRLVDP